MSLCTIADSLSPLEIAELEQAFRLEIAEMAHDGYAVMTLTDEIETLMGFVTGEYLWYSAWLFGIVVDDDLSYYVPSDHLVEVVLTGLDNPPPLEEG